MVLIEFFQEGLGSNSLYKPLLEQKITSWEGIPDIAIQEKMKRNNVYKVWLIYALNLKKKNRLYATVQNWSVRPHVQTFFASLYSGGYTSIPGS